MHFYIYEITTLSTLNLNNVACQLYLHKGERKKLNIKSIKEIFYILFTKPFQTYVYIFSFIFISWRLITLQYCSGFCHTLTWISYGFTCGPHPEPPSHIPPHPIPLGHPMYILNNSISHLEPAAFQLFTRHMWPMSCMV